MNELMWAILNKGYAQVEKEGSVKVYGKNEVKLFDFRTGKIVTIEKYGKGWFELVELIEDDQATLEIHSCAKELLHISQDLIEWLETIREDLF